MKFFRASTAVSILVLVSVAPLWAADNGWKKISESGGIVGYTRPTTKSSVDEVKAVGVVNAPIAVVEAVLRDASLHPEYMFMCKEGFLINTPELKSEGDILYAYNVTGMPFPVKDRDTVVKCMWSIDKSTGTIYCHSEGVKTTYLQKKNMVRYPLVILDYTIVPKGADKTEVTYQGLADPGGNLPAFLVNTLTRNIGTKTIEGIRKMVLKDKHKSAKTIVTITPNT